MVEEARFLQFHLLVPFAGVLVNRDESGLAKRLPYGDSVRTRISSQCLKRQWRHSEDVHGLDRVDGAVASYRSRELVTQRVIDPLREAYPGACIEVLEQEFQRAVYGDRGTARKSRQALLLGEPELVWLAAEAARIAAEGGEDPEATEVAAKAWRQSAAANLAAMRRNVALPAGLTGALFGRMMTTDPGANISAAVHVAHAFSVHGQEQELDYFTSVDDLSGDEPAADLIQESELTSALFYSYLVVDIRQLLSNLGGDAALAGRVLHHLVYLVSEVSPSGKRASTASYTRAVFVLLEAGARQPRSLAEAFRAPVPARRAAAVTALVAHLRSLDELYMTGEARRYAALEAFDVPGATRSALPELAQWASELPAQWGGAEAA